MSNSIKSVAREADIDLHAELKTPRGFRVFPVVLANSEVIAAAHERLRDALGRHRAAVAAVRKALNSVVEIRNQYEACLAHAVLNGEKEPKEPDTTEHFAEARRQMSQVRAMTRAANAAVAQLRETLRTEGGSVIEELRDKAAGFADEAMRHEESMRDALGNFGGLKFAADWLDDWTFSESEPTLNARDWNGVDAPEATILDAHKAVGR